MSRYSTAVVASILLMSASACVGAPTGGEGAVSRPAMAAYFDCVRDGGVAISAHRAVSAPDQPENSIAAIEATGRAIPGAILELDAVLTKDGHLVLMQVLGIPFEESLTPFAAACRSTSRGASGNSASAQSASPVPAGNIANLPLSDRIGPFNLIDKCQRPRVVIHHKKV